MQRTAQTKTQVDVTFESVSYVGTCGESKTAQQARFVPAFRCEKDGRVEVARLASGKPAAMHLIVGLPPEWAAQCDDEGRVCELKSGITAGFLREGRFYTRAEAAIAGG